MLMHHQRLKYNSFEMWMNWIWVFILNKAFLNVWGDPFLHISLGTYCSKILKSIVIVISNYLTIKVYSH